MDVNQLQEGMRQAWASAYSPLRSAAALEAFRKMAEAVSRGDILKADVEAVATKLRDFDDIEMQRFHPQPGHRAIARWLLAEGLLPGAPPKPADELIAACQAFAEARDKAKAAFVAFEDAARQRDEAWNAWSKANHEQATAREALKKVFGT